MIDILSAAELLFFFLFSYIAFASQSEANKIKNKNKKQKKVKLSDFELVFLWMGCEGGLIDFVYETLEGSG